MRLCYALGYYVIGPLLKWWVRGVELRAQAQDILAGRGEVAEHPDVIDEHAAPACALTQADRDKQICEELEPMFADVKIPRRFR